MNMRLIKIAFAAFSCVYATVYSAAHASSVSILYQGIAGIAVELRVSSDNPQVLPDDEKRNSEIFYIDFLKRNTACATELFDAKKRYDETWIHRVFYINISNANAAAVSAIDVRTPLGNNILYPLLIQGDHDVLMKMFEATDKFNNLRCYTTKGAYK